MFEVKLMAIYDYKRGKKNLKIQCLCDYKHNSMGKCSGYVVSRSGKNKRKEYALYD